MHKSTFRFVLSAAAALALAALPATSQAARPVAITTPATLGLVAAIAQSPAPPLAPKAAPSPRQADYGKLPLAFVPAAKPGAFVARGPGYTLVLSASEATLVLSTGKAFRMTIEGAGLPPGHGGQKLASVTNEYIGGNPKHWRTNLPNYGEVTFSEIYPGVGLRYYGHQGQLETDFIVAPGADASRIRLDFPAGEPRLTAAGAIAMGPVTLGRPAVYQLAGGARRAISASYRLARGRAAIELGPYDHSRQLIIDPTLSYSYLATGGYSTLLGEVSSFPQAPALGVDGAGEAVIAGFTDFTAFATASPAFSTCAALS
ncbi:MAG: hypothetical protein ACRD01_16625, partial [Terriglobales bacterium]